MQVSIFARYKIVTMGFEDVSLSGDSLAVAQFRNRIENTVQNDIRCSRESEMEPIRPRYHDNLK
jgi:hypothetical protein